MHPIEHLRYVARASGADPALVASEAADALAQMASLEPAGLVPACRRLVERHLTSGPVWWLSARILGADDQRAAAREAAALLNGDRTTRHLVDALPEGASVVILGWPDLAGDALRRRGDVEALVVDVGGEGAVLARRLEDAGGEAVLIPEGRVGSAAAVADLILVEAFVGGPAGVLAAPGSLAAAAVGAHLGTSVWAVTGVGRVLPERLWDALVTRFDENGEEPWERDAELVPASLLAEVVGPHGRVPAGEGLADATCPVAPELLRPTA